MAGTRAPQALTPSRSRSIEMTGSALIEALIALVLFAVGLLGLVGLQATSIQQASQAEYRSTASMLANTVASQMWLSDRTAATLQTKFSSPNGTAYTSWLAQVQASGLPGISSANGTLPTISFNTIAGGSGASSSSLATITVLWRGPTESQNHQFVTLVQLK